MSDRLLDTAERRRFMTYCQQQAESATLIAKQLDKQPGTIMAAMARNEHIKAMAYGLVAKDLDDVDES